MGTHPLKNFWTNTLSLGLIDHIEEDILFEEDWLDIGWSSLILFYMVKLFLRIPCVLIYNKYMKYFIILTTFESLYSCAKVKS